ncbi:MAG: hypothetical protein ACLFQO_14360 [Cyclobacteriaceae bacterium]
MIHQVVFAIKSIGCLLAYCCPVIVTGSYQRTSAFGKLITFQSNVAGSV